MKDKEHALIFKKGNRNILMIITINITISQISDKVIQVYRYLNTMNKLCKQNNLISGYVIQLFTSYLTDYTLTILDLNLPTSFYTLEHSILPVFGVIKKGEHIDVPSMSF